jgi:hypothetical protein
MRNAVINLITASVAAWSGFVSWWFGLITPKAALRLPQLVLVPDADESGEAARTDLPRQVVRL